MWTKAWLLLCLAAVLPAQQPDYFPLQIGNQWTYRSNGPGPQQVFTVEIADSGTFDGQSYFLTKGFSAGDTWLRMSEDSRLLIYDPAARREKLWAAFGTADGDAYETQVDACTGRARQTSRKAKYQGPLGEFDTTLQVDYSPGKCADAGISQEIFLPYVGLLRRTENTIAGPRRYDLIYARLGGVTVISENQVAFSLTLDRTVYIRSASTPAEMTARLTLRNSEPLRITTGSQEFDLVFKNEKGEVVFRWSDGKVFTLIAREVLLPPGEKNWVILLPLVDRSGSALPPGRYSAEGWLTTSVPANKTYLASVAFQIQPEGK